VRAAHLLVDAIPVVDPVRLRRQRCDERHQGTCWSRDQGTCPKTADDDVTSRRLSDQTAIA